MNDFDALYMKAKDRIKALSELPAIRDEEDSIEKMLKKSGVSRRDFMKWAAGIAAMLALPAQFTPVCRGSKTGRPYTFGLVAYGRVYRV